MDRVTALRDLRATVLRDLRAHAADRVSKHRVLSEHRRSA